ncbi:thioredoxin domain-containing protein [Terricaulis silvestris]|uniref:thioredoxin family protein n=1 Tax=Terricaulis silvestris TaxID=2686094 RepID=UPI00131AF48E|nr:thioredoxin family protein [Terricaulis silvestris]
MAPLLVALLLLNGCAPEVPTASSSEALPVSSFPINFDPLCGGRPAGRAARIYDECGSQMDIFQRALEEAQATGKTVIVSYGAEWCVWCHVFDSHVNGATGRFNYPNTPSWTSVERSRRDVPRDARALNQFASENIILAHIEGDKSPDGRAVLEATGAATHFSGGLPFIFSVTPEGRFGAAVDLEHLDAEQAAPFYQGYDRAVLLAELRRVRNIARSAPSTAP